LDTLIRQSRNFSGEQMRRNFEKLLATDLALKSAAAHPAAMLEGLVLALCSK
jgi:DNA polymerase III delta subunit